jgi:hypothetical protein
VGSFPKSQAELGVSVEGEELVRMKSMKSVLRLPLETMCSTLVLVSLVAVWWPTSSPMFSVKR